MQLDILTLGPQLTLNSALFIWCHDTTNSSFLPMRYSAVLFIWTSRIPSYYIDRYMKKFRLLCKYLHMPLVQLSKIIDDVHKQTQGLLDRFNPKSCHYGTTGDLWSSNNRGAEYQEVRQRKNKCNCLILQCQDEEIYIVYGTSHSTHDQ